MSLSADLSTDVASDLSSDLAGGALATFIANAGPDATLTYGVASALAGSASGGVAPYTYAWSVVSYPNTDDSVLVLSDATSPTSNCTLTGPNGVLVLRLTATDAHGNTATDTVSLTLNATFLQMLGSSLYTLDYNAVNGTPGATASVASVGQDTTAITQATAGKKPTHSSTAFNGLPGWSFDGGDVLAATLGTPIPSGNRPYMFLAAKFDTALAGAGIGHYVCALYSADESSEWGFGAKADGGAIQRFKIDRVSEDAAAEQFCGDADLLPHIFAGGYTASGLRTLVQDAVSGAGLNTPTLTTAIGDTFTRVRLGAYSDLGNPTVCTVAQWIVCKNEPTATQKSAVIAKLRSDWAMTDTMLSTTRLFDLSTVDAELTENFEGIESDGSRYVLMSPSHTGGPAHTKVARYDSQGLFGAVGSWAAYDLSNKSAENSWCGICFDGRYFYIAPLGTDSIRYDSTLSFTADASWTKMALTGVTNSGTGSVYCYPFYDGARYVYFPQSEHTSANGKRMVRYDTQAAGGFVAASCEASVDTTTVAAGCKGYTGGCVDNSGNVYFCPYASSSTVHGNFLRYKPATGVFTANGSSQWETFDLTSLHAQCKGFGGLIHAGRYIYLIPAEYTYSASNGSKFVRYDTLGSFTDAASYTVYDVTSVHARARGYTLGAYDGSKYLYMTKVDEGGGVLRYDTTADFSTASSYAILPGTALDDGSWVGIALLNGKAYCANIYDKEPLRFDLVA